MTPDSKNLNMMYLAGTLGFIGALCIPFPRKWFFNGLILIGYLILTISIPTYKGEEEELGVQRKRR